MKGDTYDQVISGGLGSDRATTGLRSTLAVIIPGFQFVASTLSGTPVPDEWVAPMADAIEATLNAYGVENQTLIVQWDTHAKMENAVNTAAARINQFLAENGQTWDVLLIGHSRGGVLVHEITARLAETNLGFVQLVTLDATAALPVGDHYPEILNPAVDRGLTYDDTESFINDLLPMYRNLQKVYGLIEIVDRYTPGQIAGKLRDGVKKLESDVAHLLADHPELYLALQADSPLVTDESRPVAGATYFDVEYQVKDYLSPTEQAVCTLAENIAKVNKVVGAANRAASLGFFETAIRSYLSETVAAILECVDRVATTTRSLILHTNMHQWYTKNRLDGDLKSFLVQGSPNNRLVRPEEAENKSPARIEERFGDGTSHTTGVLKYLGERLAADFKDLVSAAEVVLLFSDAHNQLQDLADDWLNKRIEALDGAIADAEAKVAAKVNFWTPWRIDEVSRLTGLMDDATATAETKLRELGPPLPHNELSLTVVKPKSIKKYADEAIANGKDLGSAIVAGIEDVVQVKAADYATQELQKKADEIKVKLKND